MVDGTVVDEVPIDNLPFVLMAAFFVYNICYPKGCNNFYSFLEVSMLKYSAVNASPSVSHLLATLSSLSVSIMSPFIDAELLIYHHIIVDLLNCSFITYILIC